MVSSSTPFTLTISDLVLAIEAGDVSSVLSCLSVMEVSTPLAVWGGGHSSPTLLAVARHYTVFWLKTVFISPHHLEYIFFFSP